MNSLLPQSEVHKGISPLIYLPGQAPRPQVPREHPGRKSRTTAAGWVLDYLVPQNKTILLCQMCNHNFNGRRVQYINVVQRFGHVMGRCDGCKNVWTRNFMYVHESLLGTRSGQILDTRFL